MLNIIVIVATAMGIVAFGGLAFSYIKFMAYDYAYDDDYVLAYVYAYDYGDDAAADDDADDDGEECDHNQPLRFSLDAQLP